MASLSINVLGALRVTRDDVSVTAFEYAKVRALLAYLAVEAGRPQPRAHLAALLWPELPEQAARRNLTQALAALRRALDPTGGPSWVQATAEAVQLNAEGGLAVDVAQFGALLTACERHAHAHWHTCAACGERLAAALALYTGEFLSQLFVADSAPFEEWALLWRERLRQQALTALERQAQQAEWRGDWGAAIAATRRQVEIDPLNEAAQRELLRRLAGDGQRAAAEAQFEQLRRRLADELAVEPDPATLKLWERVRGGPAATLRQWTAPAFNGPLAPNELIGRAGAVAAVCQQLRADGPRALTITGPAGMGKTRLALAAAHALRFEWADGVHVIELAPVAEAGQVAAAVAAALGVKEQPGQPVAAALSAWLKPRQALLVLDNCEHVLEAAGLVADLLAAAPHVKALLTSRAPLRIRAEQQYALTPLTPPEAAQLFGERVRAARGEWVPTPENAGEVAALCAQLDHLPLAIELIAVRARAFSVAELRQQLAQPLDALAHGARDLPDRHRTLRAALRCAGPSTG